VALSSAALLTMTLFASTLDARMESKTARLAGSLKVANAQLQTVNQLQRRALGLWIHCSKPAHIASTSSRKLFRKNSWARANPRSPDRNLAEFVEQKSAQVVDFIRPLGRLIILWSLVRAQHGLPNHGRMGDSTC
jgi:hypothetical protein